MMNNAHLTPINLQMMSNGSSLSRSYLLRKDEKLNRSLVLRVYKVHSSNEAPNCSELNRISSVSCDDDTSIWKVELICWHLIFIAQALRKNTLTVYYLK